MPVLGTGTKSPYIFLLMNLRITGVLHACGGMTTAGLWGPGKARDGLGGLSVLPSLPI